MLRWARTSLAIGAVALAAAGSQERGGLPRDELPARLDAAVPLGLPQDLALPAGDARTERAVALGRRLFFDPVLSIDRSVACASCHDPSTGFSNRTAFSVGVDGNTTRNTPTLFNRALGRHFSWDGRARSLEQQVLLPIENPIEMGLALEEALERLRADESYASQFQAVFGGPPTRGSLAEALATFLRRILIADSPIDRFRNGDFAALPPAARSGLWFYESRGACWRCHSGANFSDEGFHNTGVGAENGVPEEGRFAITGDEADRGRFKTPTLRGLTHTAPYMHDGSLATLEEVVDFYRRGGHPNANLDHEIGPLDMTDEDAANLVAFLRALSPEKKPAATSTEIFEGYVLAGGLEFDARFAGPADGELILMLHGFPQTSYAFRHQMPALARAGYRVVAPDLRGYSAGARPEGVADYAMAHLVDDVFAMAGALGRDTFHLVGHDWGGAIAWAAATRSPERVLSLAVLSTPHYQALARAWSDPASEQSQRSGYMRDFAADGAEQRFLADDAALLRGLYAGAGLSDEEVGVYVEALGEPETLRAALNYYRALNLARAGAASSSLPGILPIEAPTLYVWSSEDAAFSRAAAERTADYVSGPYRFEVLEGISHWIPEQAAERTNELLLEHFAGLPAGR